MTQAARTFQPGHKWFRRSLFFGLVLLIAVFSTLLFADWLQRTGLNPAKWTLMVLYAILTTGLAFGFAQSCFGFLITLVRGDPLRITKRLSLKDTPLESPLQAKVALLFPIYNEDPKRFFSGIETTYKALEATGQLEHFSFFILSDSTDPNRWIEEENRWLDLTQKLNAHGRITYRHRTSNINQKSGNVSDFCRRWGSHFDHMICFDADSLMSASCILKLTHLMEQNPQVGIIQTMPGLFGAETLFARLQQFANRIHGGISGAGLNFWQQSEGNYWGHNAIIRLKPFVQSCALPELPGPRPLGGRVLSHDFVEAALMRKAGYEVWLAGDIEDSFEELPPTLLDFAQRDRRWCQGNLQHAWIALFGAIPAMNRIHMLNGIYAYIAAPLWLCFLAVSTLAAYSWERSGLSLIVRPGEFFLSPHSLTEHGLAVLAITLGMLFLPKLFTCIRLLLEPQFRADYGGALRGIFSIFIEVFFFSLIAPAMMLFHSSFVLSILCGNKVAWNSQNRQVCHTTWLDAARIHGGHTLVGILWGILAWRIQPSLFFWMSPVLIGWWLAVPLSVFTSHTDFARSLRKRSLLLTPEESAPPEILEQLRAIDGQVAPEPLPIEALRDDYGLIQAILDPYTNTLHRGFLPKRKNQTAETADRIEAIEQRLISEGAPALSQIEKARILNNPKSIQRLHHQIWTMPEAALHKWWRLAINRYSRRSLFVTNLESS
jgi:membrane glycosyltransferase